MKIRIDRADSLFSQYIRLRDSRCVRCLSGVKLNEKGLPVSHTASHFYGRGKESTRFEPLNVDTLCLGCHRYWGSDDREGYREFKLKQLGVGRFKALMVQANTYKKKDRKMEVIKWTEALKLMKPVKKRFMHFKVAMPRDRLCSCGYSIRWTRGELLSEWKIRYNMFLKEHRHEMSKKELS